ncbi:MAG: N-acetyltransferase [Helicobacter sp.]|nr:N-acetyltransferase [Helicobacter sp.]
MPKILEIAIKNVTFGTNVTIIKPCNLYDCKLQDNVFVGPFVEIQNDVIIGQNTRIQSHSFICAHVNIGSNCFIAHGVMFVNDKFYNGKLAKELLKTSIGDNVLIGSNATILPVTICSNVTIGSGTVVTKDISKPGIYAGNPAVLIKEIETLA